MSSTATIITRAEKILRLGVSDLPKQIDGTDLFITKEVDKTITAQHFFVFFGISYKIGERIKVLS